MNFTDEYVRIAEMTKAALEDIRSTTADTTAQELLRVLSKAIDTASSPDAEADHVGTLIARERKGGAVVISSIVIRLD